MTSELNSPLDEPGIRRARRSHRRKHKRSPWRRILRSLTSVNADQHLGPGAVLLLIAVVALAVVAVFLMSTMAGQSAIAIR